MVERTRPLRLALSFSACGMLVPYHLGIISSFRARKSVWSRVSCFMGVSGGAIAAAVGACCDSGQIENFLEQYSYKCQNLSGLEQFLPQNAHKHADGRLVLGVTKYSDGRPLHISQFSSRQAILAGVRASCAIPRDFHPLDVLQPWKSTFYPTDDSHRVNGEAVYDGGFSDSLLGSSALGSAMNCSSQVLGDSYAHMSVVKVSPFSGQRKDICPSPSGLGSFRLLGPAWLPGFQAGEGQCEPFRKVLGKTVAGQHVDLSLANARRAMVSLGAPERVLRASYDAGLEDGSRFLSSFGVNY